MAPSAIMTMNRGSSDATTSSALLANVRFSFFVSVVLLVVALIVAIYAIRLFHHRTRVLKLSEDDQNMGRSDLAAINTIPQVVVGCFVALGMLSIFVVGFWQLIICIRFIHSHDASKKWYHYYYYYAR